MMITKFVFCNKAIHVFLNTQKGPSKRKHLSKKFIRFHCRVQPKVEFATRVVNKSYFVIIHRGCETMSTLLHQRDVKYTYRRV